VLLDFSQASLLTDGFVTENSIVLVEGEAVDGVLHVHHIGKLFMLFDVQFLAKFDCISGNNEQGVLLLRIDHLQFKPLVCKTQVRHIISARYKHHISLPTLVFFSNSTYPM
jgi:hypothetical protein